MPAWRTIGMALETPPFKVRGEEAETGKSKKQDRKRRNRFCRSHVTKVSQRTDWKAGKEGVRGNQPRQ